MKGSVTDREVMRDVQGDRVLLNPGKTEQVLVITHFIDGYKHTLELDTRSKTRPGRWPLTQALFDRLKPSTDPRAKWTLSALL